MILAEAKYYFEIGYGLEKIIFMVWGEIDFFRNSGQDLCTHGLTFKILYFDQKVAPQLWDINKLSSMAIIGGFCVLLAPIGG